MVEQGTTLILVCRVVGVPSTTVLSYQWTCPGGYCDAGAVDPEWAARIQQGNILVVNVRRANGDNGVYTCTVMANTQVGAATYTLSVASELCTGTIWHATPQQDMCMHLPVNIRPLNLLLLFCTVECNASYWGVAWSLYISTLQ